MAHRLKLLPLLLVLALAIGAVSAVAAQAAEWTVNGSELHTLVPNEASVTGEGGPFVLASPNLALEIECEKVEVVSGKIFPTGQDSAKVEFKGHCKVKNAATCGVVEPITAEVSTHLETIGGKLYDVYTPAGGAGATFTTIEITGCSAKGKYPVKGSVAAEVEPLGTELVVQPQTFGSTPAGTGLTLKAQPAVLTGNANVWLTGAYLGDLWGAK